MTCKARAGVETQPEERAMRRVWAMPPGYQSPSGSSNSAQNAITRRASGSWTVLKNCRCSSGVRKSCQPSMLLAAMVMERSFEAVGISIGPRRRFVEVIKKPVEFPEKRPEVLRLSQDPLPQATEILEPLIAWCGHTPARGDTDALPGGVLCE